MAHTPTTDLVYLSLRCTLSILAGIATALVARYSWRIHRSGQHWQMPATTAVILGAATVLSIYDAIDNFVLRPHDPVTLASWLWFLSVDIPMPMLAIWLVRIATERDRLIATLSERSVTDPLTGVLNRRGFLERAGQAIAQARRTASPIVLAMFDIDRFKAINDGYGHATGDQVLRAVAACLSTDRRAGDLVGRVGGEEFAVLLLASDPATGVIGAERLCARVRSNVTHPAGPEMAVTLSSGVAAIPPALEPEAALGLAFRAADAALYAAKRGGRDRVIAGDVYAPTAP